MRLRRLRPTPGTFVRLICALLALSRIARGARRRPPLRAPAAREPTPATGSVSIIIPARDEQDRLGPCLRSLAADDLIDGDVLVVDDGSDDGTAAVALAHGVRVIAAGNRPPGWAGKSWALQTGALAATGDWLMTLDADTRVDRGLVGAAVAAAEEAHADLLTVAARVDCASSGERFLHPAMLATLVYRFGPPDPCRPGRASRALASGQCMVVPRRAFLASGGFDPVAGSLTEDVALARHIATQGGTVRFVDGTTLLEAAGYGTARAAWDGWGRSFSLAEVTPRPAQAADLTLIWTVMAAPAVRLLLGRGDLLDATLVAMRLGVLVALAGSYRRRGLAFWLSPLADVAAAARMTSGTIRPVRTWRGRSYGPAAGAPVGGDPS